MRRQQKPRPKKKTANPATILRFTEDHLWVRAEAERAEVGISDYGQDEIGEMIGVELPNVGDRIEQGEPFGEIESVRTIQELIAPISGTVLAVNGDLEDHPALANEDPYHEGWMIEVELTNEKELDDLMASEEYEELVSQETDR